MRVPTVMSSARTSLPVFATAAALWLIVAAVVAVLLWRDRLQHIERAKVSASATTALLEAHTANTLQAVDLAMRDVSRRLEQGPLPRHDPALREAMRAMLPAMPYVRALFVIGPDGFIQHDTDYPGTPDLSLADRGYFLVHRKDPALLRSISPPLLSRSGTGWFVASTRRVGDVGAFRGVVVAAIQLNYFAELYRRLGLSEGYRIVLFHRDGRLMAQHPGDGSSIGKTFAGFPLFRSYLPQEPRGVYVASGPPLPHDRIFSYETVRGEPMVVGLGQDMSDVLAAWFHGVWIAAGSLALLLVLLAGASVLLVRAQEQHRRLRERSVQGEKMEAMGQLTGSIAHDFGNLLSIVGTSLELMRRTAGHDTRARDAIDRAQQALDNGAHLTRQLMSLARKRALQVADVDLREVVAAALPLLEQAAGSGIEIVFEPPAVLPACRADRSQVDVALINLVVNARDAMGGLRAARGRVVLRLAPVERAAGTRLFRRAPTQRFVELAVEDNGPGMPEDVRLRAVEPFFTTKGEAGTGLGLAQVYGVLHQLGGDVVIDSEPGKGTTVRLLFPVAA
jgi:signal transduction histidine kinase